MKQCFKILNGKQRNKFSILCFVVLSLFSVSSLRFWISLLLLVSASPCLYGQFSYPQWWIDEGVITNSAATNDFALLKAGQLKWLAVKAVAELNKPERGGAGEALENYVGGLTPSNDFHVVNKGQLKYMASLFYDRFAELAGRVAVYPWPVRALGQNDFAPANIGQAKYLFSFDFGESTISHVALNSAWYSAPDVTARELIGAISNRTWTGAIGSPVISVPDIGIVGYEQANWKRYYLSSLAGSGAGWAAEGLVLVVIVNGVEYELSLSGPIDLTDFIREGGGGLTIELRYTGGGTVALNASLLLLEWDPDVNISFLGWPQAGDNYYLPDDHTLSAKLELSSSPPVEGAYSVDFKVAIDSGHSGSQDVEINLNYEGIVSFQSHSPAPPLFVPIKGLRPSDTVNQVTLYVNKVTQAGEVIMAMSEAKFSVYGVELTYDGRVYVNLKPGGSSLVGWLQVYWTEWDNNTPLEPTLILEDFSAMAGTYVVDGLPIDAYWTPVIGDYTVTDSLGIPWPEGDGCLISLKMTCEEPDLQRQPLGVDNYTLVSGYTKISVTNTLLTPPAGGTITFMWDDPPGQTILLNGRGSGTEMPFSDAMEFVVTLENGSIPSCNFSITSANYDNPAYNIDHIDVPIEDPGVGLDSFVDVDIDSANTRDFAVPEKKGTDDTGETFEPGKLVCVNAGDADSDSVPDFADFQINGAQFVPLVISMPHGINLAGARLLTDGAAQSDPAGAGYNGSSGWVYEPGGFRIWTKDAGEMRNPASALSASGDFFGHGEYVDLAALPWESDNRLKLFVEGISPGPYNLHVQSSPRDQSYFRDDEIKFTVVAMGKIQYKYYPMNDFADMPSDILYVPEYTYIEFRAVPNPCFTDSSGKVMWPTGKPVWGGEVLENTYGDQTSMTIIGEGTNYITAQCGNTVTGMVTIINVQLEELTFSDNTGFTADNGAWIGTGNQKWTPTYKTSALFTQKDHKAKLNTKLNITPQLSSAMSMTIHGTADNGVTFTKTFDFPASTTSYTVNDIEASTAYDANFDYIGTIDWKITYAACEQDLPDTDNNIYYVPEGVHSAVHLDTVLYVVCKNMDGKPHDDATACTVVFGEFSDCVVKCADRTTVLKYWKVSTDQDRDTTEELLNDRSGSCVGWSDFLRDCFTLAGPSSSGEDLDAKDGGWVIVKDVHWKPDPPGTQGPGQTWPGVDAAYQYKEYDGANGYRPDAFKTIPGQGTPVDPSVPIYQQWIDGHFVVKSGGEFYDPSYGKHSATQEGLEDLILQGTAIQVGADFYLKLNTAGADLE